MELRKILTILACSIIFASVFPDESMARRGVLFGAAIKSFAKKSYSEDTHTVESIKKCLARERDIQNLEQEIEKYDVRMTASSKKLDELGANLRYLNIGLNLYSEADVRRYNQKVELYETMRASFNDDVKYYNILVAGMNGSVESFNASCAGKKYYEDDMQAAVRAFSGT